MDELLGALRQAGLRDSHGHFTLEPETALLKLSQSQLADPRHFGLHMVAAAERLRPSELAVEQHGPLVRFRLLDATLDPEELPSLVSHVLTRDPRGSLILALATARLSRLIAQTPAGSASLSFGRQGLQTQSLPPGDSEIALEAPGTLAELARPLRERCVHATVPLRIEDRLINEPLPLTRCSVLLVYRDPSMPELPLGPVEVAAQQSSPSPGEFTAVLAVDPDGPTGLICLLDGLRYEVEEAPLPAGVAAYLWSPLLQRDLSLAQVVRDAMFERLVERVRALLLEGLGEVLARLAQPPPRPQARQVLAGLVALRQDRSFDADPAALALLDRLRDLQVLCHGSEHEEVGMTCVRQADILRNLKRFEEAEQHYWSGLKMIWHKEEVCISTMVTLLGLLRERNAPEPVIEPLVRALVTVWKGRTTERAALTGWIEQLIACLKAQGKNEEVEQWRAEIRSMRENLNPFTHRPWPV